MSLTLTYLSHEFINTVREHYHFKEFISENALDHFASIRKDMQLENS